MHFVAIVPLGLAIAWVIFKVIAIGFLLLIAAIIWGIYVLFFKKEEPKEEESDEDTQEIEYWDRMMEKQQKEDAEFYKKMGRLEQQLDDLEQLQKPKRRRKK